MSKDRMVKAAVCTEPNKIEIQYFPYPEMEPGAAILKNIKSGVCGTDKHMFSGSVTLFKGTEKESSIPYPVIFGHEAVGIIDDITPEGAKHLEYYGEELHPGDRVTYCPDVVCHECYYCRLTPWYPWCESPDRRNYGCLHSTTMKPSLFGSFAEYMYIFPKTYLYKVPDRLSDDLASCTEWMCVSYALDKAKEFFAFDGEGMAYGDTVVVLGCGPVGLAHVIKARMLGAGKIIVTDQSDFRLNIAKEFGADVVMNVSKTTTEERIDIVRQHTHGWGADIICDCSGVKETVPEGLEMVRKGGMFIEPGQFVDRGPTPINMNLVCSKSIRIIGMANHAAAGYRPTMEMMLRYEKDFPWHKIVSHRFGLDEVDKAIRASMGLDCMKVIVEAWDK